MEGRHLKIYEPLVRDNMTLHYELDYLRNKAITQEINADQASPPKLLFLFKVQ